jgi:hypothetical protein
MRLRHVRRLASVVVLACALVVGGVVGNDLLLGAADTSDPAVGTLSARLKTPTAPSVRPSPSRPPSVAPARGEDGGAELPDD